MSLLRQRLDVTRARHSSWREPLRPLLLRDVPSHLLRPDGHSDLTPTVEISSGGAGTRGRSGVVVGTSHTSERVVVTTSGRGRATHGPSGAPRLPPRAPRVRPRPRPRRGEGRREPPTLVGARRRRTTTGARVRGGTRGRCERRRAVTAGGPRGGAGAPRAAGRLGVVSGRPVPGARISPGSRRCLSVHDPRGVRGRSYPSDSVSRSPFRGPRL